MSKKASNKESIIAKAKTRAMGKIIDALMDEEFLTVADAAEVLMVCNNTIKDKVFKAMTKEEEKPLSEALSHLKRSKILVPGANDINHVKSTKIH